METKKKLYIGGVILLITLGVFMLYNVVEQRDIGIEKEKDFALEVSLNPLDTREIGYEFLDANGDIVSPVNADTVHMWNVMDDYYFNKSSGMQFTNHFQDYWTTNTFCIGYYSGETWNKIYCADELNDFNRNIITDNNTYINATLWKDISYGDYDLRLGIRYSLKLNDHSLSVSIYGRNIGQDIPFDLGFAWKIKNVNVSGIGQDYININETEYPLNDTYDLTFKNMSYEDKKLSFLVIKDETQHLDMSWNENLNYAVKIYSDGTQENFYTMLLINAGHFDSQEEKHTTLKWIDAEIDIGVEATDRSGFGNAGATVFNVENPANADGTIDTIQIWAYQEMSNVKVGTFYGSGTSYQSRDYETIGTVIAGSMQEFTGLDIDVLEGDFIGIYFSGGRVEIDATGGSGIYLDGGDQFGAGVTTYNLQAGDTISLYGSGETPAGDTCTYSSGDWVVACSDNCVITDNSYLPANTLRLEGTGTFTVLANITVDDVSKDHNCEIININEDGNKLIKV